MTSQCRCMRALRQSHDAKHGNHVPVTPLIGSGLIVVSMQWLLYGKIISAKTLKLRPSVHNGVANLFVKAQRYQVGTILIEILPPLFVKSSGPHNCTFTTFCCTGMWHYAAFCTGPHSVGPWLKLHLHQAKNYTAKIDATERDVWCITYHYGNVYIRCDVVQNNWS